jgi:BASS family bile acid:Na+ symporter
MALDLQDLAIQALNISLMFSVGLELDLVRLRRTLDRRALLLGVTALNFGFVPLLALGVARGLGLSSAVFVGLMLAAVSPGGGTGTLLTRTARGNLELSVVLLGLFTALAVPLVPGLALLLLPQDSLSLWPLLRTLLVFQLLPLGLGLTLRLWAAPLAARLDRLARPLSNLIFAALVLGLLVTKGHLVVEVGARGIAALCAVVVGSLVAPLVIRGPAADRSALSLTTGVRNLSLALLLASAFFTDTTTLTVLTYGLVMYLVGVPAALVARRVPEEMRLKTDT